jgi:dihydrofolate reductase
MNAAVNETGAVLMGRKTFAMADPDSYVGTYEFQVPIFVLTHHPPRVPPKQDERLTFTFVSDGVASAIAQAKAATGDKAVQVVGGANVIQQVLRAGLVDQLHIDIMPFGQSKPQPHRALLLAGSSAPGNDHPLPVAPRISR